MGGLFDEVVSSVGNPGAPAPEPPPESASPAVPLRDAEPQTEYALDPGAPPEPVCMLADGLERLRVTLEEKHALDRFRETQIDRLHSELQEYRSDLVAKAVRPVLQSMIRLHHDIGKVADALRREQASELTPERLLALLDGFQEDVEIALDQHGVHAFRTLTEEFDPRRQTVSRRVETDDLTRAGQVAGRLNPGFEQGDALLQKERVAVYVIARSDATRAEGAQP